MIWVIKNSNGLYYHHVEQSKENPFGWAFTDDINKARLYTDKGRALDVADEQMGEKAVLLEPVGGWREA